MSETFEVTCPSGHKLKVPSRHAGRTGRCPRCGKSVVVQPLINAAERSRAYINGTAATLGLLREAADFLADIHGQNAHHSLLRADAQRDLLDAHAGAQAVAKKIAAA